MAGSNRLDFLSNTSGPQTSPQLGFSGGKIAIIATATTWTASTVQFQILFLGKLMNIGTPFSADGMQIVEVPAGQLQVTATGAALAALNASALTIPTITIR